MGHLRSLCIVFIHGVYSFEISALINASTFFQHGTLAQLVLHMLRDEGTNNRSSLVVYFFYEDLFMKYF